MKKRLLALISISIALGYSFSSNNAVDTGQEAKFASKGALIEAAFIIENKAYEIKNIYAQIKREFENAQVQAKHLEQDKILLEATVEYKAQEKIRQEFESLVHASKFMQKIYSELIKIGDDCKKYTEEKRLELADAQIPYKTVRAEVRKAQGIKKLLVAQQDCVHKALDIFQQEAKVNIEQHRLNMVHKLLSNRPSRAVQAQLRAEKIQLTQTIRQAQRQVQHKSKEFKKCIHTVQQLNRQLAQMGFEQVKNHQFLSILATLPLTQYIKK